jgi:alpha-tubulin suppressor-like RCC1 family protein
MLDIFVFGSGSFGELGLGNKKFEGKKPEDVKRPRLNYNLLADKVSVVQVACGGMYAIALIPESLGKGRHRLGSRGTFKAQLAQSVNKLMKSANMFGSTSMIIILLITMLQLSLVMSTLQFLGQFASKRYHIPLANTG